MNGSMNCVALVERSHFIALSWVRSRLCDGQSISWSTHPPTHSPCRLMLSHLGSLLMALALRLRAQLSEYVHSLTARPKELAGFVAYVEDNWKHLDAMGELT